MRKHILLYIALIFISLNTYSQCAMCKAVVENGDTGLSKGLNDGIITLMIIPYILVAIVAFVFWKRYSKNKKEQNLNN